MFRKITFRFALFSTLLNFMLLAPPAALAREIRVDAECSLHDAITLTEPLPAVTTDLTIDGRGHQISGDKLHQVFLVYNHELAISNLHIIDGFSEEHGGALYSEAREGTFTRVTFMQNQALNGGGIFTRKPDAISLRNSIIAGSSGGEKASPSIAPTRITAWKQTSRVRRVRKARTVTSAPLKRPTGWTADMTFAGAGPSSART